jgi:hypothetical protein
VRYLLEEKSTDGSVEDALTPIRRADLVTIQVPLPACDEAD